jgi:hypothetical protein
MFDWGIQFGLMRGFSGIQLFVVIKHRKRRISIQKSFFLWKAPTIFHKVPEEKDPTVLAEKSNARGLTPEDIISGNFEQPQGLKPEEIGIAKL